MNEYSDKIFRCPVCGCTDLKNQENFLKAGSLIDERFIAGKVLARKTDTVSYISKDTDSGAKTVIKEYFPEKYLKRIKENNMCCLKENADPDEFEEIKNNFEEKAELFSSLFGLAGSVQYIDTINENNTFYYVREYIEGLNFAEYSANSDTSTEEKLYILKNVMAYIQLLHNSGAVHGSVKPENIIIKTNGEVVVTDFGFSGRMYVNDPYSAPEICSGGEPDVKSDVYSLASLAYFIYTGKSPETRVSEPVQLPEDIARTIMYGMAKNTDERCKTVSELFRWLFPSEKMEKYISSKTPVKNKKSKGIKQFAAFVAAAAVVLAGGSLFGIMKFNSLMHEKIDKSVIREEVTVPDLSGLTLEQATTKLKRMGLTVKASDKMPSDEINENSIMLQNPLNGEMCRKGDVIYVTISSGNEEDDYLVSKYTGMKFREVSAELEIAGINVEVIEDSKSILPKGTITDQSVESGEILKKGSTIKLTVSSGTENFDSSYYNVPRFKGMNIDYIKTLSGAEHFAYNFVYEYSSEYIEGIIFAQSVESTDESGNLQLSGTEITLYVSRGFEKSSVPDTQYKDVDTACDMLINSGLQADIRYEQNENVQKDHVIYQSISPREKVNRGTNVIIYVSSGGKYDTYEEEYIVTVPSTTTQATTSSKPVSTSAVKSNYNSYTPSYTYYATTYYKSYSTTVAWYNEYSSKTTSYSKGTGTVANYATTAYPSATSAGHNGTATKSANTNVSGIPAVNENPTVPVNTEPYTPIVTETPSPVETVPPAPVVTEPPIPVETYPPEPVVTEPPYIPVVTDPPYVPVVTDPPYIPPVEIETTPVIIDVPVQPETPVEVYDDVTSY